MIKGLILRSSTAAFKAHDVRLSRGPEKLKRTSRKRPPTLASRNQFTSRPNPDSSNRSLIRSTSKTLSATSPFPSLTFISKSSLPKRGSSPPPNTCRLASQSACSIISPRLSIRTAIRPLGDLTAVSIKRICASRSKTKFNASYRYTSPLARRQMISPSWIAVLS